VVYVQNSTGQARSYQLSVQPPVGIVASFDASAAMVTKQINVPPFSSAAETVYAALAVGGNPVNEAVPVSVVDLTAGSNLAGTVVLNNDLAAPSPLTLPGQLSLLEAEVHNPAILNPAILNPAILNASVGDPSQCISDPDICVLNPAILNPAILNPAILNPAILNPAILNPAILNPAILNPAIFNPAILNPAIFNPAILNPAILNPAILNPAIFNPAILNPAILNPAILNPAILNPAILNPAILNPAILNPAILNPAILNPAILNPAILNATASSDTRQVDVTFAVRNDGNATTAYSLNLDAPQLVGLDYELMVYRLNETPVTNGCELTSEAQQQLIFNQPNPTSTPIDGTFYLEPGQEILVTFRVLPDVTTPGVTPGDPVTDFDVATLGGQATSQPTNTDGSPQPPDDTFGASPIAVITSFNPSVVFSGTSPAQEAALDVAVGVTGYTIEDFEDLTLVPGLTVTGGAFGLNSQSAFPNAIWDGANYFVNQVPTGNGLTFSVAGGTSSFGIGMGDIDVADIHLFVNDEDFGSIMDLPNFVKLGDNVRDVYVRIDAAPGETINSVRIEQVAAGFNDGIFFDHVAFSSDTQTAVSLWQADGDALDSNSGNNGTLQGGAGFAPGRIGQAFSFDNDPSGGQYVRVADNPSLQMTTEMTMSAWIYPTSAGLGSDPIVINKEGEYEFSRHADGSIWWAFSGPGGAGYSWVQGAPAGSAPLNTWTHVAITFDNGTVVTYLNGFATSTNIRAATIGDFYPTFNELWIGARQTFATWSGWFDGRIDEVGIYDTALTPTQVFNLYNAAPPILFITGNDLAAGDNFGTSAIDGDTMVIGASRHDGGAADTGAAYVFTRSGATWVQQAKLEVSGAVASDWLGNSVDISGDQIVLGALFSDRFGVDAGAAHIFERTGSVWSEVAVLRPSVIEAGARFGSSVAISGTRVAVGADHAGPNSGAVYVFDRPATGWSGTLTEDEVLNRTPSIPNTRFGSSLDIHGSSILVGARDWNGAVGEAFLFDLTPPANTYDEVARFTASDGTFNFGFAVALTGTTAVIGAPDFTSPGPGKAYVFERPASGWVDATETLRLEDAGGQTGDSFGWSVGAYGDTIIVGALGIDLPQVSAGGAFVYRRSGAGQPWALEESLVSPIPTLDARFGASVATSGGTYLVAEPGIASFTGRASAFERGDLDELRISNPVDSLVAAKVGVPYEAYIVAAGGLGAADHVWGFFAGLPPGLSATQFANTGVAKIYGTPTSSGNFNFGLQVSDGLTSDLRFFDLEVQPVPPIIVSTITEPIRPGTGYVVMDFDPSAPLPANWQALGWQLLADDGSVFGPQNIWGQSATRFVFRPFSTRLPAGADVPGSIYFADSGGTPISNQFPVTFSQTPGAPVIERVLLATDAPTFCGGSGSYSFTLLSDGDSAPAGSWLAVEVHGVDTFPGGVAVFNGIDTADCGITTGGVNSSLQKFVQVPAGLPAGAYTLQWRAGQGSFIGPPSAARSFTN
jgi:uncharacterized protein YjbI with pentapeptide repeats